MKWMYSRISYENNLFHWFCVCDPFYVTHTHMHMHSAYTHTHANAHTVLIMQFFIYVFICIIVWWMFQMTKLWIFRRHLRSDRIFFRLIRTIRATGSPRHKYLWQIFVTHIVIITQFHRCVAIFLSNANRNNRQMTTATTTTTKLKRIETRNNTKIRQIISFESSYCVTFLYYYFYFSASRSLSLVHFSSLHL